MTGVGPRRRTSRDKRVQRLVIKKSFASHSIRMKEISKVVRPKRFDLLRYSILFLEKRAIEENFVEFFRDMSGLMRELL